VDSFNYKLPYLVFGFVGAGAGIMIYYLLPVAILNFNLGLLLEIFFMILVGMIMGLTLIALNIQRALELFIVNTFLFLETKSMKILVTKNLSAHRESNRLTSIIYSLTLGSIIFVIVASNLMIKLFTEKGSHG